MKNLLKRKGSEVWQARFRVPTSLWKQRERLVQMGINGVPKAQEHTVSTKEYDHAKAKKVFTRLQVTWNDKMDAWAKALEDGPQRLTHKQLVALANEYRLKVVKVNEDEPFNYDSSGPDLSTISHQDELPDELIARIGPDLSERLKQYLSAKDEEQRTKLGRDLVSDYPELLMGMGKTLSTLLKQGYKQSSSDLEAKHNLILDDATRDKLRLELAFKQGEASRHIKKLQQGDYSKLDEVESFAPYQPSQETTQFRAKRSSSFLTFEDVLAKQKQLSDQRLDKQYKSEATFRKYRGVASEFSEWRNSANIHSVTYTEAEQWRDELLEKVSKGNGKRTTVRHKVSTLSSLLNWSISQNKADRRKDPSIPKLFPEGNPLKDIDLPSREHLERGGRAFTLEQARAILEAARNETKPSLRWIPWLQAYSGMRINEAAHIRKEDVNEYKGVWYYLVRSDDEHKTKTGLSRYIPLHHSIIEEGFIQFVEAAPSGLLFKEKRLDGNMREWVHKVLEPLGGTDGKPPSHGWRQLFPDLALGKLDQLQSGYIEGRAESGSREAYGKSLVRIPELAKALNNIDRIV